MKMYLCADAEVGFSYAADWVQEAAQLSYRSRKWTAVILPHPWMAIRLRKILVSRGTPFVNIHFWTPEELRSRLLRSERGMREFPKMAIASREELHLILSSVAADNQGGAAEESLDLEESPPVGGAFEAREALNAGGASSVEHLLRRSVEANPAPLLRVLDLLDSAGLPARMFESLGEVAGLAETFYETLGQQGLRTVSATDRFLASCEWRGEFESLLIFGFHGGHWPLFSLLIAACRATEKLEVLLDAPRDASFDLDSSWVGTREQVLGVEARPLEGEAEEGESPSPRVEFLAEESTHDLARALALQAAKMVGEGAKSVAVVFPAYGALSREVAIALGELQIPHFDAIGHVFSRRSEEFAWRAWCTFQQTRTVRAFAEFLTLLPNSSDSIKLLQKVSGETLSSDIRICLEFARICNDGDEDVKKLAAYYLLPERASFAEFCEETGSEFVRLGGGEWSKRLRERQEHFQQPAALFLNRSIFLRWLQEALREEQRVRDPMGSHPYAPIQLMRRDQAALCSWTHVIFAGMNAGQWPEAIEESGFLPADTIASLNRQISSANTNTWVEGAFGEGHLAVSRIPCLGPREREALQRRDFQSLRQAPVLVASTQLRNDLDPAVPSRSSLWFSELFHEFRGKPPSVEDLRAVIPPRQLQEASQEVVEREVWEARAARLDETAPFGPWEFSTNCSSLDSPPPLTVGDAERIFREPALVWMKIFLGVEPPRTESALPWAAMVGTWTHRWLRSICVSYSGWRALPDKTSRRQAILDASEGARSRMEKACHSICRPLPPWWILVWQQARSLAFQFSDQLEAFRSRFPYAATERSFGDVNVGSRGEAFFVRGRWDLLLCDDAPEGDEIQPFAGSSLLVVDYKTGRDLKISSLPRDGTGVQLALYARAVLARGAQRVDAAWVNSSTVDGLIQLPFEELEKIEPIFRVLGRIVRQGTFGMRGELRSEYTFRNSMPLATLLIPQDVLEAKWKFIQNFEKEGG